VKIFFKDTLSKSGPDYVSKEIKPTYLVFEIVSADQARISTGFVSTVTSIPPPVAVWYKVQET